MKPIKQWFKREQKTTDAGTEPMSETSETPEMASNSPPIKNVAELGDRVRDPITGFTGIVTVTAHFLHGCVRCGVAPEELKDGLPQNEQHFDQAQLDVVEKGAFSPATVRIIETTARRAAEDRAPGGPPRENGVVQHPALPPPPAIASASGST